jgi:hypothetical protein
MRDELLLTVNDDDIVVNVAGGNNGIDDLIERGGSFNTR